ncbi:MAG: M23 family metallopeptidase [Porticoccaceae bacterium]|nr:M23 family metallopeptidase [Porticoccaceae bacterium]
MMIIHGARRLNLLCLLFGSFFSYYCSASALNIEGDFVQGGLLLGRVSPSSLVLYEGETLTLTEEGHFIIGLGRDAADTLKLSVIDENFDKIEHEFLVTSRQYDVQDIVGVPQRTVTPNVEDLARIREEAALVRLSRQLTAQHSPFLSGFRRPAKGPITGVYGSQRIYNGVPKSPHYGVDYAAPEGTLVIAPSGGIVVLAEPDLFYSGGTLIIDHGHGLSSSFLHLSEILVSKGDSVQSGQSIAKIGATGRATGPHLDWRMNWKSVRIDPQIVLQVLPE